MRPIAVVIPGFTRNQDNVWAFGTALADAGFGVFFKRMPGHGPKEPLLPEITLEALADELRGWLEGLPQDRPKVIVGESLGGLVAMAVARQPPPGIHAVIAADPPLTTLRQTGLKFHFTRSADRHGLWAAYGYEIFGLGRGDPEERDYRPWLSGAAIPIHVFAGGANPHSGRLPSVLDSEDRELIRAAPGVTLHEIAPDVGHLVLEDAPLKAASLTLKLAGQLGLG